ncbi:MAG: tripartite tricarboxylate transporter substrate binding protein [Betaproteobacteria bacterium]|nr:tripartite tricarboxylate transporter substrate binding protein [Betaproteobacteria bacterium]
MLLSLAALAAYPDKPVRVIVAQPAGGNADLVSRSFAQKLTDRFGVQFVVDNRGGGGGIIGTELVIRAVPDGYTLLIVPTALGTNPALVKNLPFDARRDLAPISQLTAGPNIIVVPVNSSFKNLGDIIAAARAQPGKLSFASSGLANATHMAGELFKYMAKVNILHVPYKGSPAAMVAVSAGETELAVAGIAGSMPLIRSGRIRPIATTGAKRWQTLPDVPTIAESGVPGYESSNWYAMFAPLKMPSKMINQIYSEISTIAKSADMRSRLIPDGQEPLGTTPKELEVHLANEIAKWTELGKAAGLTAN